MNISYAIGSSRESNPSRRICHLRAIPLGHVANKCLSMVRVQALNTFKYSQSSSGVLRQRVRVFAEKMILNAKYKSAVLTSQFVLSIISFVSSTNRDVRVLSQEIGFSVCMTNTRTQNSYTQNTRAETHYALAQTHYTRAQTNYTLSPAELSWRRRLQEYRTRESLN